MGAILTKQATIVADAGPASGLGHLSRAGAAAVALRCHGFDVRALVLGSDEPIVRDGIRWTPVDQAPRAIKGVVVVDSYLLDADAVAAIRGAGPLLAFADGARRPPAADILVGHGLDDPCALDGLVFACLRPMFWGLEPRAPEPQVGRVLVSVGASTVAGGAALAAAVAAALPDCDVRLVAGPYAEETPAGQVTIVRAPEDLLGELLAADLVVSAAGQTMLEAACTGTPCVALAIADNQRFQLAALEQAGAVVAATAQTAPATVARLAADAAGRAALAERSRALVDGFGALRLAWRLLAWAPR